MNVKSILEEYGAWIHLGSGGFGAAYRGVDPLLARPVVLKLLPYSTRAEKRQWLDEARSLAHRNLSALPTIYRVFADGNHVCLVLEWLPGVPLNLFLTGRHLPPEEALSIALDIAQALAALHEAGLSHGDIKPANILCLEEGGAKLIDMGLAATQGRRTPTVAGGTAGYMAPEKLDGGEFDPITSDVYSLGVLLYELFFGARPPQPRQAERLAETLPVPGHPLLAAVQPFIVHCLQPIASSRPHSAMEAAKALRAVSEWFSCRPPSGLGEMFHLSMAEKCVEAARSLLKEGRDKEAYALLLEALEHGPDNPTALELLKQVDLSAPSNRKRRRRMAMAVTTFVVMIAATLYWWKIPRPSPQTGSISTALPAVDAAAFLLPEGHPTENRASHPEGQDPLPLQTRASALPTGKLILKDLPAEITVRINGNISETAGSPHLDLPPGTHRLSFYHNDSLVVEAAFEIRPFQELVFKYAGLVAERSPKELLQ